MTMTTSDWATRARRLMAEAIGTFFLVLIGPGTVMVNVASGGAIGQVGIGLAFTFVVVAMVYALGHLSGAHINPAVTVGFWSVRRFPASEVVPYIAAQCTGAVGASLALRAALGTVGSMGATMPTITTGKAFVIEWLLSFALMFVIMAVATDDRVADGFAPLAVGRTVGFCALMGGPLTGASMNPARSLGPALVGDLWKAHWLYWIAPTSAMVVAARTYDLLRSSRPPRVSSALGVQGPITNETASGRRTKTHARGGPAA
jgi:MIP family channel proteins